MQAINFGKQTLMVLLNLDLTTINIKRYNKVIFRYCVAQDSLHYFDSLVLDKPLSLHYITSKKQSSSELQVEDALVRNAVYQLHCI